MGRRGRAGWRGRECLTCGATVYRTHHCPGAQKSLHRMPEGFREEVAEALRRPLVEQEQLPLDVEE